MNRTTMGMGISMMHLKGLSIKYWEKAVHTKTYLRNQSLMLALYEITPYEAWYGTKPLVNHLWVFSSTFHSLFSKEKRTKLEKCSMKCILLGYLDEKKGYMLLSDGKIIIIWDVVFDKMKVQAVSDLDNHLNHLEFLKQNQIGLRNT